MAKSTVIHSKRHAAARVNMSLRAFHDVLKRGEIPIIALGARKIGVAEDDLLAWIKAKREPAERGAAKRRPKSPATQEATPA